MNIVIICGGRYFSDRIAMEVYIRDQVHPSTIIMHGGQRGADALAGQIARELGRQLIVVPANWDGNRGRSGGFRRNELMLTIAQSMAQYMDAKIRVVAFPGGVGTAGMVELAWRAHVEYRTVGWTWTPPTH